MRLLAQQGFGKARYIDDSINDRTAYGAILSPRDEDPIALETLINNLRTGKTKFIAVDPQFYAFTIPDARLRRLADYPYYPGFLTRRNFSRTQDLRRYAVDALEYQKTLNVSHFIAPSIALMDLRDSYSQVFVSMAQESLEWHEQQDDSRPLLLSLILNESALNSSEAVDEFLDVATSWSCEGMYICVQATSSAYPANLGAAALANLLYIIYVLSELNDYSITIGFCDFNSFLFGAAGASFAATGWYNSLKQFSLNRWIPSKGGARPRPRYSSSALLASILIEPELSEVMERGLQSYALSGTQFDSQLLESAVGSNWPASVAFRAHIAALSLLGSEVAEMPRSAALRLNRVMARVERARSSYLLLVREGVSFQTRFGFLDIWQDAIERFIERS